MILMEYSPILKRHEFVENQVSSIGMILLPHGKMTPRVERRCLSKVHADLFGQRSDESGIVSDGNK